MVYPVVLLTSFNHFRVDWCGFESELRGVMRAGEASIDIYILRLILRKVDRVIELHLSTLNIDQKGY